MSVMYLARRICASDRSFDSSTTARIVPQGCFYFPLKPCYNDAMKKRDQYAHPLVSWLRIGFGLLAFTAIAVQLATTVQNGNSVVNFLSFFTIESNVLAAVVLLIVGIGALAGAKARRSFAFIRGAATLYMVITGIVFALLLAGLEQRLQVTVPWINVVLHYIMPVVMLVDWLLFPPRFRFSFKQVLFWLIFPLAYLVYSLVRGAMVGWYPYPFLDVSQAGLGQVIVVCAAIAVGATGLSWLLSLRTRYRTK